MKSPVKHFLDLSEIPAPELRRSLDAAASIKARRRKGQRAEQRPLEGKVLALIFDKPSTRTRVSFDVGMRELGGETIKIYQSEVGFCFETPLEFYTIQRVSGEFPKYESILPKTSKTIITVPKPSLEMLFISPWSGWLGRPG